MRLNIAPIPGLRQLAGWCGATQGADRSGRGTRAPAARAHSTDVPGTLTPEPGQVLAPRVPGADQSVGTSPERDARQRARSIGVTAGAASHRSRRLGAVLHLEVHLPRRKRTQMCSSCVPGETPGAECNQARGSGEDPSLQVHLTARVPGDRRWRQRSVERGQLDERAAPVERSPCADLAATLEGPGARAATTDADPTLLVRAWILRADVALATGDDARASAMLEAVAAVDLDDDARAVPTDELARADDLRRTIDRALPAAAKDQTLTA